MIKHFYIKQFNLPEVHRFFFAHIHLFKYSFCLHRIKCKTVPFQTVQCSMSTKLNSSKYFYVSLTIQWNINICVQTVNG